MSHQESRAPVVVDTSRSPFARLRPVPISNVYLTDNFWAPRLAINREETIPGQYLQCEATGRIDNFRRASGKKSGPFEGIFFNDSDVYKWLEAASSSLAQAGDPTLMATIDTVAAEIEAAQQPDGYLNTYYMHERASERWSNLRDMHELYCAGHFFQAAVAHHRATGSEALLAVARRFADLICATFGPEDEGKRPGAGGHEEIEMALVELYRATNDEKYLRQADYFIGARGHKPPLVGGSEYHQDHKPVREQDRMIGHAVRHAYLASGAADVYLETGDRALLTALEALWRNMTARQMYVTGGVGSRHEGEAFGRDFELPGERAYAETCAAIGSLMWSWRMLAIAGEARFADLIELCLYNGILSGLSLDGRQFFYVNPLAADDSHRRQEWFGCACCPPNLARLLAQLPGYFYSVSDDAVWLHLYAAGQAEIAVDRVGNVPIVQRTNYPWDGDVEIEVGAAGRFDLMLRIPGWCRGASASVNGDAIEEPIRPESYLRIRRDWKSGDTVRLSFPMAVRRLHAHPHVAENSSRVAIARGPLVYCVEGVDHPGLDPRDLVLPADSLLLPEMRPDLLGGVVVLAGTAIVRSPASGWQDRLYAETQDAADSSDRPAPIVMVPYYAWANRDPGRMQVWLREEV